MNPTDHDKLILTTEVVLKFWSTKCGKRPNFHMFSSLFYRIKDVSKYYVRRQRDPIRKKTISSKKTKKDLQNGITKKLRFSLLALDRPNNIIIHHKLSLVAWYATGLHRPNVLQPTATTFTTYTNRYQFTSDR